MPRHKMPRSITLEFAAMHKEKYYTDGEPGKTMPLEERLAILHQIRCAQKRMIEDPQYAEDLKLPEYEHVCLIKAGKPEGEIKKERTEYMRNYRMSRPEETKEQRKQQARSYARAHRHKDLPKNNSAGQKKCTSCKVVKSLSEFLTDARTLDGVAVRCQDCADNHVQEYKLVNTQKPVDEQEKKARQRAYIRTYMRKYRARQKEQLRESV
jgi:hypothetical protein